MWFFLPYLREKQCGMLVESRRIRELLNAPIISRLTPTTATSSMPAPLPPTSIPAAALPFHHYALPQRLDGGCEEEEQHQLADKAGRHSASRSRQLLDARREPPRTYRFSLNPLPALVILLLGLMMSAHHQSSMEAAMVHKQVKKIMGLLFSCGLRLGPYTYTHHFAAPQALPSPARLCFFPLCFLLCCPACFPVLLFLLLLLSLTSFVSAYALLLSRCISHLHREISC
jgi:hypothetical protein